MSSAAGVVLTIGHSNHSLDRFLELLRRHEVGAIADVRSAPYSRRFPQFNREPLARWLRDEGIRYDFLGRELGGRSDDSSDYDESGCIRYDRLRRKPGFERGLDRVLELSARYRMALLCAERDPLCCHRFLLVAHALAERAEGPSVGHVMLTGPPPYDSGIECHERVLGLLLEATGQPPTLWGLPEAERTRKAIAIQTRRYGYRSVPAVPPEPHPYDLEDSPS